MSITATGTFPVEPYRIQRRRDSSGVSLEYFWRGPKALMEGVFDSLATHEESEIQHDGALYEVSARTGQLPDGQKEDVVDEIRLTVKKEERDILGHHAFDSMTTTQMVAIEESITNKSKITSFTWPTPKTDAERIYELAFRGVKSFPVQLPILTRTLIASKFYQFDIAYSDIGAIISPTAIKLHLLLSMDWPFNLPADEDDPSDPLGRHWGWFKNAPDYSVAANSKAVLTQSFEYGQWPAAMYGEPITTATPPSKA
jgi:hypothetical protein